MAGTTTKLALYLPGGGLSGLITPDEQVDIDKINDNMKKIDTAIGFVVCTSGTRPATPFTGQSIIETDTRNTMYWTGARWAPMDTLPNAGSIGIRDVLYPAPVSGNMVFRTDLLFIQTYSGTSWKFAGLGMVPIIPTSVVNGTVSATGVVAVTAGAPAIRLNGIFSADFESYLVKWANVQHSVAATLMARLAVGGIDDLSSNYSYQVFQGSGPTAAAAAAASANIWSLSNGANANEFGELRIDRPFLADNTHGISDVLGVISSTSFVVAKQGLRHSVASSFDGITFSGGTGNLQGGNISVFGYNH